MIRVELPFHLRTLTQITGREVTVEVAPPVTIGSVLDAVEAKYPVLRGTIREHVTQKRRPFLRFYACEEDYSNLPADTPLPDDIVSGKEPFAIIGAIAGG
jgi:sulfur-carrier protein